MPTKYKILTSLVFAGVVVFAAAIFGMSWFNSTGAPWLAERSLSILMLPGALGVLFLMGFVWYRLFLLAMGILRVDLDE
jgi:hypothetical protein